MGKLGRFLDSLPEDAKDRMIRDQRWIFGRDMGDLITSPDTIQHARACVMVQAVRAVDPGVETTPPIPDTSKGATGRKTENTVELVASSEDAVRRLKAMMDRHARENIGVHYDKLCERFGLERIVRCIKKRLGHTPETTESEAPATRDLAGAAST